MDIFWIFNFHLFCGPLADRFGRRPILLFGIALFVFASVGCAFSNSIYQVIFFRVLQGMGACVGPTMTRTIARDVFGADEFGESFIISSNDDDVGTSGSSTIIRWLNVTFFH